MNDKIKEIEQELLDWTILKDDLRKNGSNINFYIFNNFIYWAHLGINVGSEQEEDRPVLVIRTTKESTICNIIPITLERLNDDIPYHIDLSSNIGTALVEQVRTISKDRIFAKKFKDKKHVTIDDKDRNSINFQLNKLYQLKPIFIKK